MLNESPTDIRDDTTVVIYAVQKVLAQFARHHAGDRIGTNRGVINPGRIKLQFVADLIEMDRTLENALVDPGVCRGGIGRANAGEIERPAVDVAAQRQMRRKGELQRER